MSDLDQFHTGEKKIVNSYTMGGGARGQISYYGSNYFIIGNTGVEDNQLELWKRSSNASTFLFQRVIAVTNVSHRGLCNDGKYIYLLHPKDTSIIIDKYTIDGDIVESWTVDSRSSAYTCLCFDASVGTSEKGDWSNGKYFYTIYYDSRARKYYVKQLHWDEKKVVKETVIAMISNFDTPVEMTFDGKYFWLISDYGLACLVRQLSREFLGLVNTQISTFYDGITFDGKYIWCCEQ